MPPKASSQIEAMQPGEQLADYTLLERVARGGQAVLWSGWDHHRERVVAIKIFASAGYDVLADPFRLEREAHLVASLAHPNILPLIDFGAADQVTYFVMPYIASGSLRNRLENGPLTLPEALVIGAQIADALSYIHVRGIIHRDLKPGNVMLDSRRHAYLSDFGLAREVAQFTEVLHTGHGTPPYAPPEQHTRASMTPQSDIYSFGILLYETLTGILPWGGSTSLALQQLYENEVLPSPHLTNPTIPPELTGVLRKLTAAHPEDRPETVEQAFTLVREALQAPEIDLKAALGIELELPDDAALARDDARSLLEDALSTWNPATEPVPFTLTEMALIDSVYARADRYGLAVDDACLRIMLRGALAHNYHQSLWWHRLDDPTARLEVCIQAIMTEGDQAVGQALALLLSEITSGRLPSEALPRLSPAGWERLATLATTAANTITRHDALTLLERTIIPPAQWQPGPLSADNEARLVELALSDLPQADRAARLIAKMRSETAVLRLMAAENLDSNKRAWATLAQVREEAGSLPRGLTLPMRWHMAAARLRRQVRNDRFLVTWVRVTLGLAASLVAILAMVSGLFASLNLRLRDTLFQGYPVSDIVTIVSINDASLARFGRWDEWPRLLHAQLIDQLDRMGARVIVLDVTFTAVTAGDAALADAMARAGHVVQPVLGQGDAYYDTPGTARYDDAVLPQPDLVEAGHALGHTNILHDVDGYVRRMPTVITVGGKPYTSLPLAAIQTYLQIPAGSPSVAATHRLEVAGRSVPVGPRGEMLVHYAGPPSGVDRQVFNIVSYQDVIDGVVDPALIDGKIVLVGMMATAEPDRYLTPVSTRGRPMYGVEILANTIETIWSGRFIVLPGPWVQAAILVMLGLVTALIDARPWLGLLILVAEGLLFFVLSSLLFDIWGIMLNLLYPFIAVSLSYALVTAYRLSVEVRRRRWVMRLFESRVSPDVAEAVLKAVEQGTVNLSGEMQEVTILMAKLHGHTTYARSHSAQEVMSATHAYLNIVAEAVFVYEGTIIHGDGHQVMAIFNAPLPQAEHARRAVYAALDTLERVAAYHDSLRPGHVQRDMAFACGVYTGYAIVGHGGSGQNQNYTAVGEAVSLASALADAAHPGQVLIAAPTYERVVELVTVAPAPAIHVRGLVEPIEPYVVEQRVSAPVRLPELLGSR